MAHKAWLPGTASRSRGSWGRGGSAQLWRRWGRSSRGKGPGASALGDTSAGPAGVGDPWGRARGGGARGASGVCPAHAVTSRRALLCGPGAGACGWSLGEPRGCVFAADSFPPPSLRLLKNTTGSGSPARSADALDPPQPWSSPQAGSQALRARSAPQPPRLAASRPGAARHPSLTASVPVLSGPASPPRPGTVSCHRARRRAEGSRRRAQGRGDLGRLQLVVRASAPASSVSEPARAVGACLPRQRRSGPVSHAPATAVWTRLPETTAAPEALPLLGARGRGASTRQGAAIQQDPRVTHPH